MKVTRTFEICGLWDFFKVCDGYEADSLRDVLNGMTEQGEAQLWEYLCALNTDDADELLDAIDEWCERMEEE